MDDLDSHTTEQIYVFTAMEAEGEGQDPAKLALVPPSLPQ